MLGTGRRRRLRFPLASEALRLGELGGIQRGAETGRVLPLAVVHADGAEKSKKYGIATILLVVITTNRRLATLPGNVTISPRDMGLKAPSVVNVSQSSQPIALPQRTHRSRFAGNDGQSRFGSGARPRPHLRTHVEQARRRHYSRCSAVRARFSDCIAAKPCGSVASGETHTENSRTKA